MKRLLSISLLLIIAVVAAACAAPAEPTTAPPTPTTAEPTAAPALLDIVDTAAADGRFTTLAAALQATGLIDTLKGAGPFTVFAPTDDAFAKLPAGTLDSLLADPAQLSNILLYHVVAGKVMAADVANLKEANTAANIPLPIKVEGNKVMVGNAEVVITDIEASNGVIHVVGDVILPPAPQAEAPADDAMAMKDIVDTAVADGRFTTLAAALQATGLIDTLKGAGPFTVFAPTDDAFAALPAGTLDSLLADPEQLRKILLYHVVSGKVMAADVAGLDSADTAAGLALPIKVDMDKVMVGDAEVVITDIETSNGVIHVINKVLTPPAE